jgi:hypothetical protein
MNLISNARQTWQEKGQHWEHWKKRFKKQEQDLKDKKKIENKKDCKKLKTNLLDVILNKIRAWNNKKAVLL